MPRLFHLACAALVLSAAGCGASASANVHLNQVGYLPASEKVAVVVSAEAEPLPWQVRGAEASGVSEPRGVDAESGDTIHWVDFSALTTPGESYELEVAGERSVPFRVAADVYRPLVSDAVAYFYHNRSGIPIEAEFAGSKKLSRPAGHLSDASVGCAGGLCDYRLDVSGGWYDAGDHGKYVVNGGIAVWTLLSWYERVARLAGSGDAGALRSWARLSDGTLRIPERGNGVADLLDEARWELDFLLRMQVPAGAPLAGMVHHKIHDAGWTAIPFRPPAEAPKRFLHPPSTAATLNLAAVAAQGARLWREVDPEFSARCLAAATLAYDAAVAHPDLLAPPTDNVGGGPYDDKELSDEFYWAAAELFITTGEPRFLDALEASPHHRAFPVLDQGGDHTSFTWQATAALGAVSLLQAPSGLDAGDREAIGAALVAAADGYLALASGQGYRLPFAANEEGKYPWGSNSFVANNAIVLALAHDRTGDARYLAGVVGAMDYLLGRNPLGVSYVTGWGERAIREPHHRFWAKAKGPILPEAPPGCLAGGPNSSIQDPVARRTLKGCLPQRCYLDDIDAWSVNEITINWNAPLYWVAAWLDEHG